MSLVINEEHSDKPIKKERYLLWRYWQKRWGV